MEVICSCIKVFSLYKIDEERNNSGLMCKFMLHRDEMNATDAEDLDIGQETVQMIDTMDTGGQAEGQGHLEVQGEGIVTFNN